MTWLEALSKVAELTKLINTLELQFKEQDKEIMLLRADNADLRKVVSGMGERLARLEEGRNTTAAQVSALLAKSEADTKLNTLLDKMNALVEENEALKRKQISSSDSSTP